MALAAINFSYFANTGSALVLMRKSAASISVLSVLGRSGAAIRDREPVMLCALRIMLMTSFAVKLSEPAATRLPPPAATSLAASTASTKLLTLAK